jgi:hypothetical protein
MSLNHFKLISNNKLDNTRAYDVILSTVRITKNKQYIYETCLLYDNTHSRILEIYPTTSDAISGHYKYSTKYGLTVINDFPTD